VLDEPERAERRTNVAVASSTVCKSRVSRRIVEERIEFDVVVWRVEARMIKDVERLDVKFQPITLGESKILENAHVDAGLEGPSEDVTAGRTEPGFKVVARGDPIGRAWSQQWNAKSRRV